MTKLFCRLRIPDEGAVKNSTAPTIVIGVGCDAIDIVFSIKNIASPHRIERCRKNREGIEIVKHNADIDP